MIDATYGYDHTGIRVAADTTTTVTDHTTDPDTVTPTTDDRVFLVDAANPTGYAQVLEEKAAPSGTPQVTYVVGDDIIAQAGAAGALAYLVYDGHGSTRLLTTATGTISERYAYDAFGIGLSHNPATPGTDLLYAGEQFDSGLGQYYLRARYYDQAIGRFSSFDRYEGATFEPTSLHKYVYTHGDPINFIDPSGRSDVSLTSLLVVGGIKGLLAGIVIGGSIAEAAYFISTPADEWSTTGALAAFGKGAATGAFGATVIGSAWFAVQGFYEGYQVWKDPNATALQKALASVNVLISMASAYFLKGQVRSQWTEWKNVFSKVPLSTRVQTDVQAIRNAYRAGATEIQIGKTQIVLGYPAPGRAAGVLAGQDDLFYLSREFLESNPTNDDILRAIIEENIHLARTRAGLVDDLIEGGLSPGFRQGEVVQAEEELVGALTDDLFQSGRQRGWW